MVKVLKTAPKTPSDGLSDYSTISPPYYTTRGDGEHKIPYAKSGIAARYEDGGVQAVTIGKALQIAAKRVPNKLAIAAERPVPALNGKKAPPSAPRAKWKQWTYKAYNDEVRRVAKGFLALGHQQFDAVSIFGFNSPEWFMSELATMVIGGKAAGVYPSDTADQLQFKTFHADASIATCEGEKEFEKFRSIIDRLPYLKAIVCWAMTDVADITRSDGSVVRVLTWNDLLKLGDDSVSNSDLEQRESLVKKSHCAALIYTSGTTGNPKAVMISHDTLCFESSVVLQHLPFIAEKATDDERFLSYLPLSHVAGMMVDIITPVIASAFNKGTIGVYFARPYDLKAGSLADRLRAVQPTLFVGVPRVWEKISEKMKALGATAKGTKKKIAAWAKSKGLAHQKNCVLGGTGAKPAFYGLANKLVLSKVKKGLGLDEVKFCFAGAAPLSVEIIEYFGSLGINVNDSLGTSESTGSFTFSLDEAHEYGSCGFAMTGVEVKVFKVDPSDNNKKTECPKTKDIFNASDAEQGEICFRGRNMMMGYLANPKLGAEHVAEIEKKNADAIDKEGWYHTGDMGCCSTRGMFKITGRYKELIIGAGGENIAPVPIEDNIKKLCPVISNIMMVGDKRKYNVCLITLKAKGATGELPGGDILDGDAEKLNPKTKTITDAMDDKVFIDAITNAIKATNNDGSVVPSNASKIQKFTILPSDFSIQTGELTATLKTKRSVVEKMNADVIDKMYASKDIYVKYS